MAYVTTSARKPIIELLRSDTQSNPVVPADPGETLIEILTAERAKEDPNDYPIDEHIFHRTAPQDAQFPVIIIGKQSGAQEYAFGSFREADDPGALTGQRYFTRSELWTIKAVCRGLDSTPADRLDERLRTLLQDYPLDLDGRDTLWFRFEEDVDYGELEEGAIIHHVGAMYRLLSEPT